MLRSIQIQEPFEYSELPSVEAAFIEIEISAQRLAEIARTLTAEAKKLSAASASGNLNALRKTRSAIASVGHEAGHVLEAVARFDEEPIARAIGSRRFLQEVVDLASDLGFTAARLSGLSILAFPNRLSVDEKGLRLGRKPLSTIRPSALARLLKADADKALRAPVGFIDALRDAYELRSPLDSAAVPLSELYSLLTLLPDTRKSYPETDFVRDLTIIDAHGPYTAKDGKRISFVASTSTRMGKGYRAVSPSGEEVTYGSIRFVDPA